jgi:predicted nucleic acid-binding protein
VSYVVDSSIWIDLFRSGSPAAAKRASAELIEHEEAAICEPVIFELVRALPAAARRNVQAQLGLLPVVPTPATLWNDAALLGQKCASRGFAPPAMDLLIAQVCIHNGVELVTMDQHFSEIARVSSLRSRLVGRSGHNN